MAHATAPQYVQEEDEDALSKFRAAGLPTIYLNVTILMAPCDTEFVPRRLSPPSTPQIAQGRVPCECQIIRLVRWARTTLDDHIYRPSQPCMSLHDELKKTGLLLHHTWFLHSLVWVPEFNVNSECSPSFSRTVGIYAQFPHGQPL